MLFTRVCHSVHKGTYWGGGFASRAGCIQVGGCLPGGSGRSDSRGVLHLAGSASKGLGRPPQVCLQWGLHLEKVGLDPLPHKIHGILWDTVN